MRVKVLLLTLGMTALSALSALANSSQTTPQENCCSTTGSCCVTGASCCGDNVKSEKVTSNVTPKATADKAAPACCPGPCCGVGNSCCG